MNSLTIFVIIVRSLCQCVDTKGIPPDYILTVAVHETGYGQSKPYKKLHNLFSMTDDKHGVLIGKRRYKVYDTDEDSIRDFVRLLSTRLRYRDAYRYAILDDRKEFFRSLQNSGYAQDPYYAIELEQTFQELKRAELKRRLHEK